MKITDVESIVLRLDTIDTTRADGTQDAFLVRVHTDEGIVGIGEADTSPYVARTIVDMPSSHAVARGLREVLLGENPLDIDRLWHLMFHSSYHYGRAGAALHTMSAIDIALWDIAGKVAGRPVGELLGGQVDRVRVYASEVMPETPDEVRLVAEWAVADGYPALKLGWGPLGRDLERDEALVRAARSVLGDERDLMLDGGMAYSVERAHELVTRLEDVRLYWLEEPLAADDYEGYRRLFELIPIRLAAGEADSGVKPFRALVEQGQVNVLQPDLARCGGFTVHARSAHSHASTASTSCPTASPRVSSSQRHSISPHLSIARRTRSSRSPTPRSSGGSSRNRSSFATARSPFPRARVSASSSPRSSWRACGWTSVRMSQGTNRLHS